MQSQPTEKRGCLTESLFQSFILIVLCFVCFLKVFSPVWVVVLCLLWDFCTPTEKSACHIFWFSSTRTDAVSPGFPHISICSQDFHHFYRHSTKEISLNYGKHFIDRSCVCLIVQSPDTNICTAAWRILFFRMRTHLQRTWNGKRKQPGDMRWDRQRSASLPLHHSSSVMNWWTASTQLSHLDTHAPHSHTNTHTHTHRKQINRDSHKHFQHICLHAHINTNTYTRGGD